MDFSKSPPLSKTKTADRFRFVSRHGFPQTRERRFRRCLLRRARRSDGVEYTPRRLITPHRRRDEMSLPLSVEPKKSCDPILASVVKPAPSSTDVSRTLRRECSTRVPPATSPDSIIRCASLTWAAACKTTTRKGILVRKDIVLRRLIRNHEPHHGNSPAGRLHTQRSPYPPFVRRREKTRYGTADSQRSARRGPLRARREEEQRAREGGGGVRVRLLI